ncbi:MAG: ABC transporter substrate-binding protein [Thermoplasmata archaeon]
MGSQRTGASLRVIWAVLAVVVFSVVSLTAGYYLGAATSKESGFVVVDDYGRTVKLGGIPDRIVSAAPTPTEILFAVGAGSQVVGVDDYSDYPAEAAALPKVGSYTLNIEAIIALDPDLIVSSDLVPLAQLEQLSDRGIPYVIFADRTLEDVFKTIRLAGVITGHVEDADELAASLEARVEAVTNKTLAGGVTKPKVYVEYYPMWTYGPGSFGDDLIMLAGGINIAHNTSSEYPQVSNEFVIAQDPEVIVYTTGVMSTTTKESIVSRPGWSDISAVENDKIFTIDDNLLSRYGPRIVDGLEELAAIIHPELFG